MILDLENVYEVLKERAEQIKYIKNFIYIMDAIGRNENDPEIIERTNLVSTNVKWLIGREFSILTDGEEEKCVNQSEFPHP